MNLPRRTTDLHMPRARGQPGDQQEARLQDDATGRSQHARRMAQIDRKLAENTTSLLRWLFFWLCTGLLLAGLVWWRHLHNQQVIDRTPIGELQDLRPVAQSTGLKPVVLVLQTSSGFLSLHGPLNLAPRAALEREVRKSGRQYVCDSQRTQCAEIAMPRKP